MTEKRRYIDLLPTIHQTETLKKFFGSTLDHAFQPGRAETLSGYIGTKPVYYDADSDFYVRERSRERQAYQLDQAMLSQDGTEITHLAFYDDYINYIKLNGGNVSDHNRLFADQTYAWCPPVDIDKVLNFSQYYWFGDRPDLIPTLHLTAPSVAYAGDGVERAFMLPESIAGLGAVDETVVAFVDGFVTVDVIRSGNVLVICDAPAAGSSVLIYRYGDLRRVLSANPALDLTAFGFAGRLTSGMVVTVSDATTAFRGFDVRAYDYSDKVGEPVPWDAFDVSGIDTDVRFFADGEGTRFDFTTLRETPVADIDHVTISRRSRDANPWSKTNYWIHREALLWSGIDFSSRAATRPIIEFRANIQLFDYGTRRRRPVSAILSQDVVFSPRYRDTDFDFTLSDWDVYGFDQAGLESAGFERIPLEEAIGRQIGTIFAENGKRIIYGDRILVTKPNGTFSNRIMTATRGITADGTEIMLFYPEDDVVRGDIVALPQSGPVPFGEAVDEMPWDYDPRSVEYYFDAAVWRRAQAKSGDPLFELYDDQGVAHRNVVDTFTGNRVFGFAGGNAGFDAVLRRQLRYDQNGKIIFENAQTAPSYPGSGLQSVFFYDTQTFDDGWHARAAVSTQALVDGVFETPVNLAANPDNEEVGLIALGELVSHFSQMIREQDGFSGSEFASNNWRDLTKDFSRAGSIIQNRSPLLRAMLLSSDSRFDYFDAVRFAEKEYIRYKNKLVQQIDDIRRSGLLGETDSVETWLEELKARLKIAKTSDFPFAFNSLGGGAHYIPPTASVLGLLPLHAPRLDLERADTSRIFIVGHDGSQTASFGDYRDVIVLAFEQSLYDAAPAAFKTGPVDHFDWYDFDEGKYRSGGLRYARAETDAMFEPIFLRWAARQKLDPRRNTGYDEDDAFTWNYRGVEDRDGAPLPGHWRAIYRLYFDTERPHETPWEMLGFHEQPDWWIARYGGAPYSRFNAELWRDIENGVIAAGPRQGVDPRFVRPGLLSVLPVDGAGNLLDPVAARIVETGPGRSLAERAWLFGDGGPVENAWRKSASFGFAKAQVCCLMRPAQWIEAGWERENRGFNRDGDTINLRSRNRPRAKQIVVHGETDVGRGDERTRAYDIHGIQQWIVDLMVSRSQSPAILGDAMRGLAVKLGHRMGGFTDRRNLRVFADNFGILPEEDVTVKYHVSQPYRTSVYSGLTVTWTGGGWIIEAEETEENIRIIPGDPQGRSVTISLGDDPVVYEWRPNVFYNVNILVAFEGGIYRSVRSHTSGSKFEQEFWSQQSQVPQAAPKVVVYEDATGDGIETVSYTTLFRTVQQVAEFIRDYARYLEAEGWVFDGIDPITGTVQNWEAAIREFLIWTQTKWAPGARLILSPGASQIKFVSAHGTTFNLEEIANGDYGLVDRFGQPIPKRTTFVSRLDEETKIIATQNNLYTARMRIGEIEHVLLFSNRTIFNDIVYQPLLNLRQPRLRLIGLRTSDWAGRRDAPGYMIENDSIAPNYERSAANMRDLFEIEGSEDRVLRDHSRHLIGYQARPYLDNLLLSETQQFEFYQGMIQSKGAIGSFDKLIRSRLIGEPRDLRFLEEWAYKIADYGRDTTLHRIGFRLVRDDIRANPQIVSFSPEDVTNEQMLSVAAFVETPTTTSVFPLLARDPPEDNRGFDVNPSDVRAWDPERFRFASPQAQKQRFQTAGYVRVGETKYIAANYDNLTGIADFSISDDVLSQGDRLWVYDRGDADFDVLTAIDSGLFAVVSTPLNPDRTDVIIRFATDHPFTGDDVGRILAFVINGENILTSLVQSLDETRIRVASSTEIAAGTYAEGSVPCLFMQSVHFPDMETFIRDRALIPFVNGDLAYVDGPSWAVYMFVGGDWFLYRQEQDLLDSDRLRDIVIYDTATSLDDRERSVEPLLLDGIAVIDPNNGRINPLAERELSFIQDNDPAEYRDGPNCWGIEQVGMLWWDLNAVRFLLTTTDRLGEDPARDERELRYRYENWNAVAPGTEIRIYEWTRATRAQDGVPFIYRREFDPMTKQPVEYYYFWSLNPTTVPSREGRALSASYVADLIENSRDVGVPWMAPVAPDKFIVGGVEQYLNNATSVLRFDIARVADPVAHQEWQILQRRASAALPYDLWRMLTSSLLIGGGDLFGGHPSDVTAARAAFLELANASVRKKNLDDLPGLRDALAALSSPVFDALVWAKAGRTVVAPPPDSFDFEITEGGRIEDYVADDLFIEDLTGVSSLDPDFETAWRQQVRATRPRILLRQYGPQESWAIWEFDVTTAAFASERPVKLARFYDRRVTDRSQISDLVLAPLERVLIESDSRFAGMWTCSQFNPGSPRADSDGLVLVSAQTLRASDFIDYTSWYKEGFSPAAPPIVGYATVAQRQVAETPPNNIFVRLADDATGAWVWTEYANGVWSVVARQGAGLSLRPVDGEMLPAMAAVTPSALRDRDGGPELAAIADLLYDFLDVDEIYDLFFGMVKYSYARDEVVPWIFKTSFLSVAGLNEILRQTPIQRYDNTQNLLDYVEEVKPYRTRIRDFTRTLNTETDIASARVLDFDKPVYFDPVLNRNRRLDPNVAADMAIIATTEPWASWFAQYASGAEELRRINLTINFDRVDLSANLLDSSYGFDILPFDIVGWDRGDGIARDGGSALARVIANYGDWVGLSDPFNDTLYRSLYKGVSIDAGGLFQTDADFYGVWDVTGFDTAEHDATIWNEDDFAIDNVEDGEVFLDHGGIVNPQRSETYAEECAITATNDSVSVKTTHRQIKGGLATKVAYWRQDAYAPGADVVVPLPMIAQSSQAVMVYLNGIRAVEGVDYVVSHFDAKVTVSVPAWRATTFDLTLDSTTGFNDLLIMARCFGTASLSTILLRDFFVGDGATTAFAIGTFDETGVEITATINGVFSAFSIVGGDIVFASAPAADADVMITVYAPEPNGTSDYDVEPYDTLGFDADFTNYDVETRLTSRAIVYDVSEEWALPDVRAGILPQFIEVGVEQNGSACVRRSRGSGG
jgi:hypothetical protein